MLATNIVHFKVSVNNRCQENGEKLTLCVVAQKYVDFISVGQFSPTGLSSLVVWSEHIYLVAISLIESEECP